MVYIRTGGQQKVQSTQTEPTAEPQKTPEVKQETKTEAPPLSKEKQAEIKHTRQAESKLAEAAIKARTEAAEKAGLAKEPAPAEKAGAAAKAAPEAPVDDPERLKKIEEILDKSSTGKVMAEKAKKEGTEFKTGPAGKGSYNSGKKIVIDKNESTVEAALTYVHEAHHAATPNADPKAMKRDEYVKAMVKEEVDGTVLSIETKNELKAAGVDTKGATFPLEKEYNAAEKKAITEAKKKDPKLSDAELEKIGKEAGRKRVEDGFMKGDVVTSTDKDKYPDYYGKRWDRHNPAK